MLRLSRAIPSAPNPLRYTVPVPVQAEFEVTGLVRNGVWSDGAELDAARRLLESRFDLKIGIWDLVDNPTLRHSLLQVEPPARFKKSRAQVPELAVRRAEKQIAKREAREKDDGSAAAKVVAGLDGLKGGGWQLEERYGYYRYPLTQPLKRWPDSPAEPLGWLMVGVTKRATKVSLTTTIYNDLKIPDYLAERKAEFERIASPASCSAAGISPTPLELHGGWGDDVDWPARASEIARRVPSWVEQLRPLFDRAAAMAKERRETRNPVVASLTITVGNHGKAPVTEDRPSQPAGPSQQTVSRPNSQAPRRSWIQKLLGSHDR